MLEVFLGKLKDIRIMFDKEVSEINKNVAKTPVKGIHSFIVNDSL